MTVLLVGLDPHSVPGVDAKLVDMAIQMGQAKFDAAGVATDTCLFEPDADKARAAVTAALAARPYDVVVIGGGLRKPDELVAVLEVVIQVVRQHAPQAALAFNTNPTTSYDAAKRWLR